MATKSASSRRSPGARTAGAAGAKSVAKTAGDSARASAERRRFWLSYPPRLITRPIIWEMTKKFAVIFNVRQASVTDEIGILCLELEAPRADLKAAIAWLERQGVKVEPVEINVIES